MMENKVINTNNIIEEKSLIDFFKKIPDFTHGIHEYHLKPFEGTGHIKYIDFGRGFTSIDINVTLKNHFTMCLGNKDRDVIYFMYVTKGICFHNFKNNVKSKRIEEFKSSTTLCEKGNESEISISKDLPFFFNIISLDKKLYFKRFNDLNFDNRKKYDRLLDCFNLLKNHIHISSYNLKIAEQLRIIHNETIKFEIIDSIRLESRFYLIIALHLDQLYCEIYDSKPTNKLNKSQLKGISDLTEFIVDNPGTNHTIQSLCRKVGISPAKLQEGFKSMHGTTVSDFVRNVRIEKAEMLLANTDLNISEVVYSIGFTSRSYFCKIFKQKYHCNPSDYKKRLQSFQPFET